MSKFIKEIYEYDLPESDRTVFELVWTGVSNEGRQNDEVVCVWNYGRNKQARKTQERECDWMTYKNVAIWTYSIYSEAQSRDGHARMAVDTLQRALSPWSIK